MARVKVDKPATVHYCGDCAHANEVQEHWNRALDGHYICVRCKFSSRSRLKSETGCENFKNKSNL